MLYQISHTTTYTYDRSVILQPHTIRLRPRSNGWQTLKMFSILVSPIVQSQSDIIDLDGNALIKVWFPSEPTDFLEIQVLSQVATHQSNPFNYLVEPWAIQFPIEYPHSVLQQLQSYLLGYSLAGIDPIAFSLAQEIAEETGGSVTQFLNELNQRLYQGCEYVIRETGNPFPPGRTWIEKTGSCRDLTVLFIEVCRSIGLAARFVSGYQEGDLDSLERHLHAWAEVYLPGAGWRGYDPTHGLAVSDRHIALAASAIPNYAAPVSGSVSCLGGVRSQIKYDLQIQRLD